MSAHVDVRAGTKTDRAFVLDLGLRVGASSASSVRDPLSAAISQAFTSLIDFVAGRDHETLIATLDGLPVGFILTIYDLPDEISLQPQAFVAYMAVEPEVQSRGIGQALILAAERGARLRGMPHFSLMVTEENFAARRLYERVGFVTERRLMTKAL